MDTTETSLDEGICNDGGSDTFPVAAVAVNVRLCELSTLSVSNMLCPGVDDLGVIDNAMYLVVTTGTLLDD